LQGRRARFSALLLALAASSAACARPHGAAPHAAAEIAAQPPANSPAHGRQLWERAEALSAQGRAVAVQRFVLGEAEAAGHAASHRREVLEAEAARWRDAEIAAYEALVDAPELRAMPERPAALLALAQALQDGGDEEAAIARYQQLAAEHPTSPGAPEAELALANLAFAEGDLEEAALRCDGALRGARPALRKRALYVKAWSLRGLGRGSYRAAMEVLREILRLGRAAPGSLEATIDDAAARELVSLYAAYGDPEKAEAFFASAGDAGGALLDAVRARSRGEGRRLERLERRTD
jgi:tetratricopeptide (TPR) repeat protein